ncbi:MAG: PAS domain S-box protein, partial [Thermoanaerobaculia bacterium]
MDGREIRRLELNRVLVELARASAEAEESLETAFGRIARAAAETLAVERVSVWLYNEDRSAIRCAELYELTPDRHSRGQELSAPSYPSYFQALESERTIAADEVCSDPRTRELTAGYLEPLGIASMLDAPIRAGGRMIGVVCHEHVGPIRRWTEDEQSFAGSIADAASLVVEGNERRRTEAALRESEERYRRIVETAMEGIWSVDARGFTTYANPRMAEMLGYSIEELIGKNAFDLAYPGDVERAYEHWERRREGVAERPEFRFVRKDGSILWTYCSATPLLDASGRFLGSFAMVIDITDRRRAE